MNRSNNVWSMVKLGLILAVYAAASCAVLAVVNNATSPVIRENQIRKANEAMKAVFAEAETFTPIEELNFEHAATVSINSVYLAKNGENILGAVAQVTGPTYDHSTIIVGVDVNGNVTGMRYLENTDTPGFGQKASDSTYRLSSGKTFYEQFTGLSVENGFTAGRTFDAISGATITSNGAALLVTEASSVCVQAYKKALETEVSHE